MAAVAGRSALLRDGMPPDSASAIAAMMFATDGSPPAFTHSASSCALLRCWPPDCSPTFPPSAR
jgi:hypothetical protein